MKLLFFSTAEIFVNSTRFLLELRLKFVQSYRFSSILSASYYFWLTYLFWFSFMNHANLTTLNGMLTRIHLYRISLKYSSWSASFISYNIGCQRFLLVRNVFVQHSFIIYSIYPRAWLYLSAGLIDKSIIFAFGNRA